jgi:DnaJ-domain-containing protein 1
LQDFLNTDIALVSTEIPWFHRASIFMESIKWRDMNSTNDPFTGQSFRWTEIQPRASFYDVLQVSSTATPEVIRAAYRALIEKYHPDKNPEHRRPMAEEVSRQLNQAYAVLSNPQKRREYNRTIGINNGLHRRA